VIVWVIALPEYAIVLLIRPFGIEQPVGSIKMFVS